MMPKSDAQSVLKQCAQCMKFLYHVNDKCPECVEQKWLGWGNKDTWIVFDYIGQNNVLYNTIKHADSPESLGKIYRPLHREWQLFGGEVDIENVNWPELYDHFHTESNEGKELPF